MILSYSLFLNYYLMTELPHEDKASVDSGELHQAGSGAATI